MFESISHIIGIIAGLISAIAWILYIIAIVKGDTEPSKITWWLLTLGGLMALGAYFQAGARETIWVPVVYVIGPIIVAILSLKYGESASKRTKEEKKINLIVVVGAFLSLVVWVYSNEFYAQITIIITDLCALIPTVIKSYFRPLSEDKTAWTLEFLANFINLFAINTLAFTTLEFWNIALYPLYLVMINGVIAFLLWKPLLLKTVK